MKWMCAALILPLLIFGGLLIAVAAMQLADLIKDIWRNGL